MGSKNQYGPRDLKRLRPNDRHWALLVDVLWRELSGLYFEKFLSVPADPDDPKQQFLKGSISDDIDFGQYLGQDHLLEGNRSAAFGQGGHTTSFMELLLGAYPTMAVDQNPEEWIPSDRLMALGNGLSDEQRSLVFEILKSGFFKFLSSIKIGAWVPRFQGDIPEDGTLQWTPENGLEEWDTDHWKPIGSTPDTITPESENETIEGKHTHKIEPGKLVTQPAHGFTFGACIKRDGEGNWITSKADIRANAGTVGIVSEVIDADHFRYITGGLLPGSFTDGADYFLSTTTAGAIFIQSDPEVWEIGNVREFIGTGTANGLEVEIDLGDEITEFVFTDASIEDIAFDFNDVSGSLQTYYLDVLASFRYKILNCTLESDGSLTGISIKKNDVDITGLSGLTISTKVTNTATALNIVEIGDVIKLVITSFSGSTVPSLIRGKLKTQRL